MFTKLIRKQLCSSFEVYLLITCLHLHVKDNILYQYSFENSSRTMMPDDPEKSDPAEIFKSKHCLSVCLFCGLTIM